MKIVTQSKTFFCTQSYLMLQISQHVNNLWHFGFIPICMKFTAIYTLGHTCRIGTVIIKKNHLSSKKSVSFLTMYSDEILLNKIKSVMLLFRVVNTIYTSTSCASWMLHCACISSNSGFISFIFLNLFN